MGKITGISGGVAGAALVYLALSLFSIRKLLFIEGTIGHNWDWPFPALSYFFSHILSRMPYTWADVSVGYSIVSGLSTKVWWTYSALTGLVTGSFHTKFVIISTTVIAGISMFFLVKDMLESFNKKKTIFPSFIAGLFFAFSPFLFTEFVGGAVNQFQTFMVMPLALLFFRKYNRSGRFMFLFLASIVISYILSSLQNFIFTEGILLAYLLVLQNRLEYLLNFIKLNVMLFLLNLYWIIPFIYNMFTFSMDSYLGQALTISDIINNVPSITEILAGHGYIRPFYSIILDSGRIYWLWAIVVFASVTFMFYLLFFSGDAGIKDAVSKRSRQKRMFGEILLWSLIFFASIALATGAKDPFGDIVLYLFKNVSLFSIFRSPQHLITLPTIALALLIGLSSSIFLEKKKSLLWNMLLLGLILFWVYPSYMTGDIGKDILYDAKVEINKQTNNWYDGDHIDYYTVAPGYKKIYSFLEEKEGDFKVLFLPMYASPYYHKTLYQLPGGGIDPLVLYSKYPSLFDDLEVVFNPVTAQAEYDIYNKYNLERFNELSKILNAKYVVLRKDVSPIIMTDRYAWDWRKIKKNIEFSNEYKKLYEDSNVVFYRKNEFLEHIYAANEISIVKNQSAFSVLLDNGYNVSGKAVFVLEGMSNKSKSKLGRILRPAEKRYVEEKQEITHIRKYVSGFEDDEGWVGSVGLTERHKQGKYGLSVVSVNRSMGRAIKEFHLDLSYFDGDDRMNLWVYVDDTDDMLYEGVNIFADSFGEDMSNFFAFNYGNDSFSDGWNRISIKKSDFRIGGGRPDWSNITRIGLDTYSKDNSVLNITLDEWYFERISTYDIEKMVKRNELIFNNKTRIKLADFSRVGEWDRAVEGNEGGVIAKSRNISMGRITKETGLDLSSLEEDAVFRLIFKIDSIEDMHPNGFVMFLDSMKKDTSNMFFYDPRRGNFSAGLNEFILTKKEFKKSGNPDWGNITRIGFDAYSGRDMEFEIEFMGYTIYRDIPEGTKPYITKGGKESERNVYIKNYERKVKRKRYLTGKSVPEIKSAKENPTRYTLHANAQNSYLIVFSEKFHPDWKLYEGDVNWLSAFFRKPLESHFAVNGYANAWYVEDYGEKKFTIYYFAQSVFIMSSAFSALAFLMFLGILIKDWRKQRKMNKRIILTILVITILVLTGYNQTTNSAESLTITNIGKASCGNGMVEKGETSENCCADVECQNGFECKAQLQDGNTIHSCKKIDKDDTYEYEEFMGYQAISLIPTNNTIFPFSITTDESHNVLFTNFYLDNNTIYRYNIEKKTISKIDMSKYGKFKGLALLMKKQNNSILISDYLERKIYLINLDNNNLSIEKVTDTIDQTQGLYYDSRTKSILFTEGGILIEINQHNDKKSLIQDTTILNTPQGITATSNGDVYIADTLSHYLYQIKRNGEIYRLESEYLYEPRGLTVDENNNIYISSSNIQDGYILKLTPGNRLYTLEKSRQKLKELLNISGVHLEGITYDSKTHKLYLATFGQHAIMDISIKRENMNFVDTIQKEKIMGTEKYKRSIIKSFIHLFNSSVLNEYNVKIIQDIPFPQINEQYNNSVQSYELISKDGDCMKDWQFYEGEKEISCKKIEFNENDIKDAVKISTKFETLKLRPKYQPGLYKIDTYLDKTLAGKNVIFSLWVKASKPSCIRIGVYRGNIYQYGLSSFNTLNSTDKYELLVYDGYFDKEYTSASPILLIEPFCDVEITNPLLMVK